MRYGIILCALLMGCAGTPKRAELPETPAAAEAPRELALAEALDVFLREEEARTQQGLETECRLDSQCAHLPGYECRGYYPELWPLDEKLGACVRK